MQNIKSDDFLAKILNNCQLFEFGNSHNYKDFFEKEYNYLRKSNFIYIVDDIKTLDDFNEIKNQLFKFKSKQKDINEHFYFGFNNGF